MIESIIDPIRSWVRTIAVLVILAGFVEILIPRSNTARFVRMTMGLVIVLAVLSPLVSLLRQPLDVPGIWEAAARTQMQLERADTEQYREITGRQLVEVYRGKLEDYVRQQAESLGEEVVAVKVSFVADTDHEDFGRITAIKVTLEDDRVGEVRVDLTDEPAAGEKGASDPAALELRRRLGGALGLESGRIEVFRR